MGLFSAVAGLFAGGSQKKASQKATDAMVAAMNRGIDTQNAFQQQIRTDYMPFTEAGVKAIGGFGDLLGTNGAGAQGTAVDNLKLSPFYQQSLDDANENLLQTASASGGVRGGNTAGAIGQLSPAILAQYYQQALSGFGTMAQLGLGAQGTVTQTGANTTDNVTNLMGQIGQAKAGNYLNKGGINASMINNVGGFLDKAASSFLPGGGSASGITKALGSIF
ncbi:hypothetical protein [Sphingomonas endolithica]|uniref:hypothetical protein n=1 Tax=Sphingomonas endolithica TaxID=2972485 RepID=UPI0021AEEA62|nr:hypothetical protein [Sphingomonas sp. ZFBP2030]